MKKLSVGLPFRGQGKVQTRSWLLLLAVGLLACMTMCLILVWSNIERIDTTYFINIAQNKLQERKALRAKLEVERERLLSPYELRRKAEELGVWKRPSRQASQAGDACSNSHPMPETGNVVRAVPHHAPCAAAGPGVFLSRPRTGA